MNNQRVVLDSTCVASVLFLAEQNVMEVVFRNGLVYRYFGVPLEVFQQMLAASSKGAFMSRFVRNRFPYQRVDHSGEPTQ